ncbi:MAG: Gfo/Idh/MocA family oxidoreductase [Armatimonadota bacterium]|nr:MAG: Gfo/Idh/MocA family oxidoreductase [Armatimonadota bacterium]
MAKLRIGLIGSGSMGSGLAKAAAGLDRAEVVAVSDINSEVAAKLGTELGADAYGDDGEQILARNDIAGVIVATPGYLHRDGCARAAQAGKHIFCEKPLATNVSDCDAIIKATDKAGVKLQVGQVLRYLPMQAKTIELVRSGIYGEPIACSITRIGGGYGGAWGVRWRDSHQKSGGILMEINAHEFDLMSQICGDAKSVYALGHRYVQERLHSPDQLFVIVDFVNGAMGQLHSSVASAIGDGSTKVQCREGAVFFGGLTLRHGAFGKEPEIIESSQITVEPAVSREVREWVDAVLDDTPVTIPGIDGRKAVELAEAAYESARSGEPVPLPLKEATGVMSAEWPE